MLSKVFMTLAMLAASPFADAAVVRNHNSSVANILPANHVANHGSINVLALSITWAPSGFKTSALPTASSKALNTRPIEAAMPVNVVVSSTYPRPAPQNPRHRKRDEQPDPSKISNSEDPVPGTIESIQYWMKAQSKNDLDTELDKQEATAFPGFYDPNVAAGLTLVPQCRNPWYRAHHHGDMCKDWVSTCVEPDTWEIRNAYACNGFTEDATSKVGKWVNKRCSEPAFREEHKTQNWCEGWLMLDNLASCREKAEFEKRPVECTRAMAKEANIKHNSLDLDWINPTCDWDTYAEAFAQGSMRCDAWHREQERIGCRRSGLGYGDGDDCKFTCLTDEKCPRREEFKPRIEQLCQDERYFNYGGHWGICKALLCLGKDEKPPVCSTHHPAEEEERKMEMFREQDGW